MNVIVKLDRDNDSVIMIVMFFFSNVGAWRQYLPRNHNVILFCWHGTNSRSHHQPEIWIRYVPFEQSVPMLVSLNCCSPENAGLFIGLPGVAIISLT